MPLPALIIIDMQRGMLEAAAGQRNNPDAPARVAELLQAWREAQAPIVHVRHISRATGSLFAPGQFGVEFQPALHPQQDEHVVEKNVPDAFINSGLERWLRVRGIESLVIVGVSTNNSVEGTARSAGNLGFVTHVLADGCFAFAKSDYNGVPRSAEEVHAMALANLQGEYAAIINCQEAVTLLPAVR
ncbi:cysteine hydrolase [Pseudomonas sp. MM211]|uniref:cysteine hydrolase family protein n=1 Tax=Pseudomonas sp. MM211 TaxID=2866808 RepID=UPI001CEC9ADA|nr:cysteine hydrolase family protein [Pseudomonas sp. MM211]UCJ15012.1 cysteine hydrolase [Pseudomonas sp. MM211]